MQKDTCIPRTQPVQYSMLQAARWKSPATEQSQEPLWRQLRAYKSSSSVLKAELPAAQLIVFSVTAPYQPQYKRTIWKKLHFITFLATHPLAQQVSIWVKRKQKCKSLKMYHSLKKKKAMILSVRYNILWSCHPPSGSDINIYRNMLHI